MRTLRESILVVGILSVGGIASRGAEAPSTRDLATLPPAARSTVDYQRDIAPILSRACVACHGTEKQRGGLRLDTRAEALKGGNSGAVLEPGHALKSRLLLIVAGLDPDVSMPPKGKPPLTRAEVSLFRAWIDQGLKWPEDGTAVVQGPKSTHWSFSPPARPGVPEVRNPRWIARNPIDNFVLAQLEREGLSPSLEADRATLLRRVTLDLIGLPPTPEEVDAFLSDTAPDAYERAVDRLLDSPHYGERWGRHWLDAARYADSDGYEKDLGRPFAWRWRDWVINALNRDLPYDRFVIEQLAGDLLPDATLEQKVATGFHRNTLTNREGGVDQEQFRVEAVVDRVNTTATVFLGLTLGCAQCHDHKYDPFSQREYYQFFAFFNSDTEVNLPAPTETENAEYTKKKAAHDARRKELLAELEAASKELPPNLSEAERKEKLAPIQKKLTAHDKAAPQPPMAQTIAMGKPRTTNVLIRGDFLRPGVEVKPGVPSVLPALDSTPGADAAGSPSRLDLARWIVRPDHPLTARVLVNWTWHKYFGRGLVPTLVDFGTQGEKPSHPELLDWLASEVIRRGWSLKALHRLIVTSATYRQSSKLRPELAERDPLNVLLARQSRLRLEAEVIRDAALASSGLLDRTIGGPSVRPPQPQGVAELTYAGSAKWIESKGRDRYRRGLYTWFQRTSPYPMLLTFDAPDGNLACVRREKSNTPLQALTLLNDTVFVECAQALARRVLEEHERDNAAERARRTFRETLPPDLRSHVPSVTTERARRAFRLVLSREPSSVELARLTRLYEDLLKLAKVEPAESAKLAGKAAPKGVTAPEAAAWTAVARTMLNLDEVVTRE